MKRFKRIYIEITNICNLNCSFCHKDKRIKETIIPSNFEKILKKINKYTDYIYLHVKGEPLLHKDLKEILLLCSKYNKKVNITTNGTLIEKNIDNLNIDSVREINISLHSENDKENYLLDIFKSVDKLTNKIVIYRFWTMKDNKLNKKSTNIVNKIIDYYNLSTDFVDKINKSNNIKIKDNLYIDKKEEFIWPSLNNDYYNTSGTCYGLKDQLGILSNGTVIPCCLDCEGIINLGNIYESSLEDIINSDRFQKMLKSFQNRKVEEELCKRCSFKDSLLTNK